MTYTQQSARPITASDLVLVLNSAGLWKYAGRPAGQHRLTGCSTCWW